MDKIIKSAIQNAVNVKINILKDKGILNLIDNVAQEMIKAFGRGNKVLFCGNGGSAADAQHLSAELSGKYYLKREPLAAEALNVNASFLTAVANDFSFAEVFSRLIKATGKSGDVLVAISTSGKSPNVIKAIKAANNLKMITVGLTGKQGNKMNNLCRYLIKVPSQDTPRIQETHILIGHIICEIVEKSIFGK